MPYLSAVVAGVAVALARGGRAGALERLMAQLSARRLGLLLAAMGGLVGVRALVGGPSRAAATVLLPLPMMMTLGRYAGSWLLMAGSMANTVVTAVNGAMPVSIPAVHLAGLIPAGRSVTFDPGHAPFGPATRLRALGDVLPVPGCAVSSVGDVLMAVGLGLLAHALASGASPIGLPSGLHVQNGAGT